MEFENYFWKKYYSMQCHDTAFCFIAPERLQCRMRPAVTCAVSHGLLFRTKGFVFGQCAWEERKPLHRWCCGPCCQIVLLNQTELEVLRWVITFVRKEEKKINECSRKTDVVLKLLNEKTHHLLKCLCLNEEMTYLIINGLSSKSPDCSLGFIDWQVYLYYIIPFVHFLIWFIICSIAYLLNMIPHCVLLTAIDVLIINKYVIFRASVALH